MKKKKPPGPVLLLGVGYKLDSETPSGQGKRGTQLRGAGCILSVVSVTIEQQ